MSEERSKAETDAIEFAKRAIEFDNQRNYDAAIYYYRVAAKTLHSAYLLGSEIAGIKEKADEYLKRAEDLHKIKIEHQQKKVEKNVDKLQLDRAEFLLRQGFEEDESGNAKEAIELYFQAAELCINARKLTQDKDLRTKLSGLAENALDRAETLKKETSPSNPDKGSETPLSPVPEISHLNISSTSNQRQLLVHRRDGSPVPSAKPIVSGSGGYTKEEIAVLRTTSIVNGREYVPFMSVDLKERFGFSMPFNDKDGKLALSPKQKSKFSQWARLEDLSSRPVLIEVIDCFSIRQTIVSDCSFISSLAVSALYEKRFKKKVITSIIYPQNKAGDPVYNPCGKYMIKMHFNGVQRKVIIDDYLPLGSHGELLCSFSSNKNEFWISLLEKAYMKVMGGYDFPGSSSSIDLHALTGWIPDRIPFKDSSFDKEKTFKMLVDKHSKGHVLVTVATGEMSEEEADRAGLVPTHAYAVLDIKEVMGKRLLLVKNPWSHLRWKGKYSEHDTKNWTPQLKEALRYDPCNAQMFDNGVFWIDYDSLLHFFHIIYVNWNPEIFKYTFCIHQCWKAGVGPVKDLYNIGENPQFSLDVKSTSTACAVWVLLSRHITDKDDFAENREFIAVVVYTNEGKKVYMPMDPPPLIDGSRINSPHYLCKILIPAGGPSKYTLVISQYAKSHTIYFTLRAYSTVPFTLSKIQNVFKHKHEIKNGEWTAELCGGCANNTQTYNQNPVYQVSLQSSTDNNHLLIDLKGPKQYYVGFEVLMVTVSNSNSPGYFTKKSSGAYRSGFNILEISDVPAGTYNIIPSTFSPGQKGPFFLTVEASCPIKVSRLK